VTVAVAVERSRDLGDVALASLWETLAQKSRVGDERARKE
jgi:hypothetical protein